MASSKYRFEELNEKEVDRLAKSITGRETTETMTEAMKEGERAAQSSLRSSLRTTERLLDKHDERQTVTIGRYDFSICSPFILGIPSDGCLHPMRGRMSTDGYIRKFRTERVIFNTPCIGFAFLDSVYLGYELAWAAPIVQGIDCHHFSPLRQTRLDLRRSFTVFEDVTFLVKYSGLVPPGYKKDSQYLFVVSLQGGISFSPETGRSRRRKPSLFPRIEERIGV